MILIASQVLKTGESTAAVPMPTGERLSLTFITAQRSSSASNCRMIIRNLDLGVVERELRIIGTGDKTIVLEGLEGSMTAEVECFAGEAVVNVDVDAAHATTPGSTGTGDLADGSVTTPKLASLAVTRPKIAPNAVDSTKLEDNAVTEVRIAPGAVEPTKLGLTGIKVFSFVGRNLTGAITLTGAAVGDRVLFILGTVVATASSIVGGTDFEATITVIDEIQQSLNSNLTGNEYWVMLIPATA